MSRAVTTNGVGEINEAILVEMGDLASTGDFFGGRIDDFNSLDFARPLDRAGEQGFDLGRCGHLAPRCCVVHVVRIELSRSEVKFYFHIYSRFPLIFYLG
jgi:hypothetical protein